jgi:hypothetical protein
MGIREENVSIDFQKNQSYQTCQVLKTWQVLRPKYLSDKLYKPKEVFNL